MRQPTAPTWATDSHHDDEAGGWIHTADLPAGDVTVQLTAWADDHDLALDTITVTVDGTIPADPVGLLRVADALARAACHLH
ncbi:hypothetical protein GCM10027418_19150 [Mariniluteicoccus endophyticus]